MSHGLDKNRTVNAAATDESLWLELEQCRKRISELARTESLLAGENQILQAVAQGVVLPEILAKMCLLIEEQCNGALCGILLANSSGKRVEHGAAPSLPDHYNLAIHGRPISAEAGACGMAACLKEQVIVADIASDLRWATGDWRDLALAHGLRACWSTPIVSSDGTVLGTFAVYWRETRQPLLPDQNLIAQTTHLAAVAIERRRNEESMRAAKARFEGILEIADDAIISVDSTQRIVLFNQGAEKVFGYAQAEVLGQSLDLLIPDRFITAHKGHIANFAKSADISRAMGQRRQLFGKRKSGEEFPAEASISKLDLGGELVFTVILRDVTEQKRLEARLRRSEQNLAEGQRLTKTGSWILDFKTGKTDWSVETCRIFGFPDPPPSPHYDQFRERVRPEDRDGVDRGLKESFETGEPRPLKYIFVLPDGTRKHIETVSQRFKDTDGELKLMGTVMDVTERVKAQEALQRSEDHLRLLIDTIPGLVWTSKPDGQIDYLSKRWMDYTGMALEQGVGAGWQEAIHMDDLPHLLEYWKSILTAGTAGEVEARLRRQDGIYRWFLFRGVPLHDEEGKIAKWYGANTDIEDRKTAEEVVRASEHLARGQVEVLKRTLDSLATETDPDRLIGHILCAVTEQLGAHSSSVWRRDRASGMIGFEFAYEDGKVVSKTDSRFAGMELSLPMEDFWPWPEVFRTGKPSVIEDIQTVPPFALRDRLLPLGIVTVLLVPLFITGHLEGAIGLRFTRRRTFRAEEVELAQALANQATLAMQLTNLHAQTREVAVIAERNRMARDLHDTLAQGFTGVITQLEATKGAMVNGDASSAQAHIKRAEALARSSLGEARRSVRAMRSKSLVDGTLSTALDELLKRMSSSTDLQAELVVQGEGHPLPPHWEEGLLRIAQESLTNTLKHAQARHFRATLSFASHLVRLQLVDDGRGFDPNAEHEGFGLLGMKERAGQMAGGFLLRSNPGQGTEIVIELKQDTRKNGSHEDIQT